MNETIIRRPNGSIIGCIRYLEAQIEARTPGGVLLGWYDRASDQTRRTNGELVALGNAVQTLL